MRILAILLAAAIAYANPVLARNGGGKHEGHQGVEQGNGGMASQHMGKHGVENSNAQWSTGAKRGQDRSDWRHQDHHGNRHEAGDRDHAGKDKHHDHGGNDKGKKDKGNKGHKGHNNHSDHNNPGGHKGHGKGSSKGADY